jgi:Tfp pilus assembly protein FimV
VRSIERVYAFAERDRRQPGTSQEETDMATMTVTTAVRPAHDVTHRDASPRRSAPARLRLTRRGQVTTVVIGAFLATAILGLVHQAPTSATEQPTRLPPTATVVVHPGETLWQIAQRVAPAKDPRTTIHAIEELNGLSSAAVQAGQTLQVPA